MIGDDFPAILAAAQDGSEDAFAVLWRDANPALLRYLRVAAPDATEDVAAEIWVQVVRGLAKFRRRARLARVAVHDRAQARPG